MECPTTPDAWKRVALGFENRWNFAHTCGALDGKHVAICKPPGGGSNYFNYKKFHSIVLMAVVDYNYNFLYVDVGTPGSVGDVRIWKETWLGKKMEGGTAGMPDPEPLSGEDSPDIPYAMVADEAFALRPWIMKPYPQRNLTSEQRIFNYRLSRARRVVENYFGILANRFRCLLKTMEQRPKNVESIVYAACVLHNLIRMRGAAAGSATSIQDGDIVDSDTGEVTLGAWRSGANKLKMVSLQRLRGNPSTASVKEQRDHLCAYYNSQLGSVPWQDSYIDG